jgi:two-component system LytT family response regulator
MINAIIVDDKYANIVTLEKLVALYCPLVTVQGTATSIGDGLTLIAKWQPDLVFLDIEMPGGGGFKLLEQAAPHNFETIFTTAYDQYAIQAFKSQALDYLLKPIDIIELQKAVQRAERQISLKRAEQAEPYKINYPAPALNKVSLPTLDGYIFINRDDIVRCEASGSYSNVYLCDGRKLLVSMRLKECEEMLPAPVFMRVHHSHIVNLKYVEKYVKGRGGSLSLADGTEIDVSNNRKDAFLAVMRKQGG